MTFQLSPKNPNGGIDTIPTNLSEDERTIVSLKKGRASDPDGLTIDL